MNENLKNTYGKRNQPFEIMLDGEPKTYEDNHRKGYVNWPIALIYSSSSSSSSSSKGYSKITHLPTGMHMCNLTQHFRLVDFIDLVDYIVDSVGRDELENIVSNVEARRLFLELCVIEELPEKKDPEKETINLINSYTGDTRWFQKDIRSIILPNKDVILDVQGEYINVDGKMLRRVLNIYSKNAIVTFKINNTYELQRWRLPMIKYNRSLEVTIEDSRVTTTVNLKEII